MTHLLKKLFKFHIFLFNNLMYNLCKFNSTYPLSQKILFNFNFTDSFLNPIFYILKYHSRIKFIQYFFQSIYNLFISNLYQ
jgi:hypothetical protein